MPTWLDKILNSQFVMIGLAGLAFLIALWLVIVIVRMLTGGRLRMSSGRTRQARLGIVDAFDLDRQRQLIIVRRDNTEHLIMIGGPNDIVIESEIVRVEARDSRRATDKAEGTTDNRIPAPTMNAEAALPSADADEPLLPMAMPPRTSPEFGDAPAGWAEAPRAEPIVAEPVRAPTFPLPPRRPAPLPERRPPPPPESATRADGRMPTPVVVTSPMAPSPTRQDPVLPPALPPAAIDAPVPEAPIAPPAPPPVASPDVREDVPPRPPVRTPPSFLKPLPPRPPIRPLRRATPVAPGVPAGDAAGAAPASVAEPVASMPAAAPLSPVIDPIPAVSPPAAEPPATPEPPRPPVTPTPKPEEANPLESLEEEMAKLLGRG